jgi:hypothetical protein
MAKHNASVENEERKEMPRDDFPSRFVFNLHF